VERQYFGPLDAESFRLGSGNDKNKRNRCDDDAYDSQNHERLRRSADELKLKKGDTVVAVVKATEVMIQKD
jgi:hypothetical protein